MRNDCKLWREGALKRSLQKFSVYANVSSGLLGKVCMKYIHKTFSFSENLRMTPYGVEVDGSL